MPVNRTTVITVPSLESGEKANHQPSALPCFGVNEIRKRTHAIQEVMRGVMKEGTHYGTIPGTPKPSLWKAGAEVLCMTFRIAPMLESRVTVDDLDPEWRYTGKKRDGTVVTGTCVGFFEVESICIIRGPGNEVLSRCSARCNNREAKYRGLSVFEIRNTILKMSEKRAFVSAVLMATGASDIFTQDIEDFPELIEGHGIRSEAATMPGDVATNMADAEIHSRTKASTALTPKRQAWLTRIARNEKISDDDFQRCVEFLQSCTPKAVSHFFDDLSKIQGRAFLPFHMSS